MNYHLMRAFFLHYEEKFPNKIKNLLDSGQEVVYTVQANKGKGTNMYRNTQLTKANIGDNYGIFGRNQS